MRPIRSILAAIVVTILVQPAAADIIIISSSSPALKSGTILVDAQSLDIPSGAKVSIMLPSGSTRTLNGPLKKSVAELSKGQKRNTSLWTKVAKLTKSSSKPTSSSIGAVRSASPTRRSTTKPLPFSWRMVPVDAEGDVCVEQGATLQLARSKDIDTTSRVTVVSLNDQKRAQSTFKAGASTAPWPIQMRPQVGVYAIIGQSGPMRQINLRLISPLPVADDILRVLHGQRCDRPVEAWLRGVQVAGK